MIAKKRSTIKKYTKIYNDIEKMMVIQKVNSIWDACAVVAKKRKMATPSVYAAYYNFKKYKKDNNKLSN